MGGAQAVGGGSVGSGWVEDLIGLPGFELVIGDCRNIQSVVSAVHGAASIVHLAAIVGDPACEQDRKAALEINYAATRMIIEVLTLSTLAAAVRVFIMKSCSSGKLLARHLKMKSASPEIA